MAHAHAEIILRKTIEKIASEKKYDDPDIIISAVSTEGANFTSFLFEATISSKGKCDLSLFAKVAAVGEKMRAQTPMRVFEVEQTFYTQLIKEYRHLEDKHGVSEQHRFHAPKMYSCSPIKFEETVVMENLTNKGYTLHDRFISVDWNYAAASFTELAKMHALSMALKHYSPEEYQRYLAEFTLQVAAMNNTEMQPFIENMMKNALDVTTEENKGRVMAFLGKEGGMEGMMKFYLPGDSPAIRHGDFRPSNLMHKVKEDGSTDIVTVDFQMLVPGTPVIDLFYFIFLGTDKAFREKHYDQLLAHYHKELSAALFRLGLDPEETYSKKQFDDDIKENLTYGLIVGLTTLGLVTVDSSDAPEVNGELDISSFKNMKQSAVFIDRLNGIIDDYVKWGIL